MTNGKSANGFVGGTSTAEVEPYTCLLSDAHEALPHDAVIVSMCIWGTTMQVNSAFDVLLCVCKKMMVYNVAQLQAKMHSIKPNWLKTNCRGMSNPYRIAHNCFVNKDGTETTALLRAAKILEWVDCPRDDVEIVYFPPGVSDKDSSDEDVQSDETELLSDIPVEVLVRKVVVATIDRGMDLCEDWFNLQDARWCGSKLGLEGPLLRKLHWCEGAEKYALSYEPLDGAQHEQFVVLKNLNGLKVSSFLGWAQEIGMRFAEICEVLNIEPPPEPPEAPVPQCLDDDSKSRVIVFEEQYPVLTGLKPILFSSGSEDREVNTWRDVLEECCRWLNVVSKEKLRMCLMDENCLWLDRQAKGLVKPAKIEPFLWIDLSGLESELFNRTRMLLSKCGIKMSDVQVLCSANENCPDAIVKNELIDKWNRESEGKIGRFVWLSLRHLLEHHMIDAALSQRLMTAEGATKELGVYLKKCPLYAHKEFVDAGGFIRCWREPVVVDGEKYYLNKEWYESYRNRYLIWLNSVLKGAASQELNDNELLKRWDAESGGKICKYAWLAFRYIVENKMLTAEEANALMTAEGPKQVLGISLAGGPMLSMREIVDGSGYRRSWKIPVIVNGRYVYLNQNWYESYRERLDIWLDKIIKRGGRYEDMLTGVTGSDVTGSESEESSESEAHSNDAYEDTLESWGKEFL